MPARSSPSAQNAASRWLRDNPTAMLSLAWLAFALGMVLLALLGAAPYWLALYCGVSLLASAACFVVYSVDKLKAQRQGRRIPENTLHGLALLGGWPGAILGQVVYRHKTKKLSFRIVLWVTVLLHLTALGLALYAWLVYGASAATDNARPPAGKSPDKPNVERPHADQPHADAPRRDDPPPADLMEIRQTDK